MNIDGPALREDGTVTDVPIRDDMIRLGQFLKLASVIETGGEAKLRITAGEVTVNGEVEVRRGRQLHRGDVVVIDGESLRVA
ncbi:RNA-binding S4 domain-containing protein [Catellatospora chokoriensis]|nr:RNA-binding S4 domain-containing protein [Catellatospora chokoriensis]